MEKSDLKLREKKLPKYDRLMKLCISTINHFNEIDSIIKEANEDYDIIDNVRSDFLHFMENYELNDESMKNVVSELIATQEKHREIVSIKALGKTWYDELKKIIYPNSRTFFAQEVGQRIVALKNMYKDKVLTDEDWNLMLVDNKPKLITLEEQKGKTINDFKPKNKSSRKKAVFITVDDKKEIYKKYNEKVKIDEIMKEYNLARCTIYKIIKEVKDGKYDEK